MKSNDDFFDKVIHNLHNLDGQELNGGMQKSKTRLAKDDRGAWINRMADQCACKEEMDIPPPELDITHKDIIRELVKRKIRGVFEN